MYIHGGIKINIALKECSYEIFKFCKMGLHIPPPRKTNIHKLGEHI